MCVHITTKQHKIFKKACHSLKTQHLLFLRRQFPRRCWHGHPVKKPSVFAVGRTAWSVRKTRSPSSSAASTCWERRWGAPRRQRGKCSSSCSSRSPTRAAAIPATRSRVLVGRFLHQRLFLVRTHVQGTESRVLGGWRVRAV